MNVINTNNIVRFSLFFSLVFGGFFLQAMNEDSNKRKVEDLTNESNKKQKIQNNYDDNEALKTVLKNVIVSIAKKDVKSVKNIFKNTDTVILSKIINFNFESDFNLLSEALNLANDDEKNILEENEIEVDYLKNDKTFPNFLFIEISACLNPLIDTYENLDKEVSEEDKIILETAETLVNIITLCIDNDIVTLNILNTQDNVAENTILIHALYLINATNCIIKKSKDVSKNAFFSLNKYLANIATLLIIKKGVNIKLKNYNTDSAFSHIDSADFSKFGQLLLEKGAKVGMKDFDLLIQSSNNALTVKALLTNNSVNKVFVEIMYYHYELVINALSSMGEGLEYLSHKNTFESIIKTFKNITKVVIDYNDNVSETKLYDAITASENKGNIEDSSSLTKNDWLKLALIRKEKDAIQYCIDQKMFSSKDVDTLQHYLSYREFSTEKILNEVTKKPASILNMLTALAVQPIDIMPMDISITRNILEKIEKNQQKNLLEILSFARKNNNKEFGKKIIEYKNVFKAFEVPFSRKLSFDEIKIIASFLVA